MEGGGEGFGHLLEKPSLANIRASPKTNWYGDYYKNKRNTNKLTTMVKACGRLRRWKSCKNKLALQKQTRTAKANSSCKSKLTL